METTGTPVPYVEGTLERGSLATAEIGRRLVSKNAVVGKAHRLDLPSSPVAHSAGHGYARPPRPSRSARRSDAARRWRAFGAESGFVGAGRPAPQPSAPRLQPVPDHRATAGYYLLLADRRAGTGALRFCDRVVAG